jgi:hypothetical protein
MRWFPVLLAIAAALGLPRPAAAQLVVEQVRVGWSLAGGESLTVFKAGAWTPITVRVRGGEDGFPGGKLQVETLDSDDVLNVFTIPVPRLAKGAAPKTLCAYVKPGCAGAEITLAAFDHEGKKYSLRASDFEPLDFSKQIYLSLGSSLPDLGRALLRVKAGAERETEPTEQRTHYLVHADDVKQLPTRWYGYEAVDLLVFPTGNRAFLKDLLADREQRKEAVAGWVRRGGRLVMSVSANTDLIRNLLESWKGGPAALLTGESIQIPRLGGLVQFAEAQDKPFEPAEEGQRFTIPQLDKTRRDIGPLLVLAEEGQEHPLVVRMPFGQGSVTILAVDLDRKPFTAWDGRGEFWQRLIERLAPRAVTADEQNDLATDLQKELEVFPDVRPISFGWVAFIIFLYIVVVGPLDYLFLRKVVKRLEWTWVTFPATVVAVSVIAFLLVSGRQEEEVKINKVDLIDIDQLGPEPLAQGTTWFAVYSPRIQTYNVGTVPDVDWTVGKREKRLPPETVVSWLGRPELAGLNSTGRRRAQALLRGKYAFKNEAARLSRVPFPFASTKSFTARWQTSLPRPLTCRLASDPENPDSLSGSVTNYLPATLENPVLFYGGKWYTFSGPLTPGRPAALAAQSAQEFIQWQNTFRHRQAAQTGLGPLTVLVNNLLFHDRISLGGNRRRNNTLRFLDQSWRLRESSLHGVRVQEAILYGRLPRREGPRQEVERSPTSPSRLVFGPSVQDLDRAVPAGTLAQDTYVRVFLPVPPAK